MKKKPNWKSYKKKYRKNWTKYDKSFIRFLIFTNIFDQLIEEYNQKFLLF